jgi:hypothetical protein
MVVESSVEAFPQPRGKEVSPPKKQPKSILSAWNPKQEKGEEYSFIHSGQRNPFQGNMTH